VLCAADRGAVLPDAGVLPGAVSRAVGSRGVVSRGAGERDLVGLGVVGLGVVCGVVRSGAIVEAAPRRPWSRCELASTTPAPPDSRALPVPSNDLDLAPRARRRPHGRNCDGPHAGYPTPPPRRPGRTRSPAAAGRRRRSDVGPPPAPPPAPAGPGPARPPPGATAPAGGRSPTPAGDPPRRPGGIVRARLRAARPPPPGRRTRAAPGRRAVRRSTETDRTPASCCLAAVRGASPPLRYVVGAGTPGLVVAASRRLCDGRSAGFWLVAGHRRGIGSGARPGA